MPFLLPFRVITKQWLLRSSFLTRLIVLTCVLFTSMLQIVSAEEAFLAPETAFQYELTANDDGTLTLNWAIAPEYYLYRKRLSVNALDELDVQVDYPSGDIIEDEFFGESEVYYGQVALTIHTNGAESLQLRWQGCADAGLCYPPQSAVVEVAKIVAADDPSALKSVLIANSAQGNLATATAVTPNASATTPSRSSLTTSTSQQPLTDTPVAPQSNQSLMQSSDQTDVKRVINSTQTQQPAQTVESSAPVIIGEATNTALAEDQQLASRLASHSLWINLSIFFGLGLLLSFTPCVLPMIPILSSVIVGSQARKMRAFILSLAFVVAMAVTYAIIGVVAALAGASVQATLQQPAFIVPLVIIFVLLALSMFGLYELQLPSFIRQRLHKLNNAHKGGSIVGASIMGVFSALLASPCMTAPLAGALIYIADSGNAIYGGLTLFVLGLGMGAPLILMATVGSVLLPKPGMWMNQVKAIFGFILLGTAVWFLSRLLVPNLQIALWGAWLLALGSSIYLSRHTSQARTAWDSILLVGSIIICTWGIILMIGAAGGGQSLSKPLQIYRGGNLVTDEEASTQHLSFVPIESMAQLQQNLTQSQQQERWTLVDFYADWCVSCKVIESQVFTDPEVAAILADMSLLRADVTDYDTDDKLLMSALNVLAPPSILLFDPQGNEVRSMRVVGELTAKEFLQRLPRD